MTIGIKRKISSSEESFQPTPKKIKMDVLHSELAKKLKQIATELNITVKEPSEQKYGRLYITPEQREKLRSILSQNIPRREAFKSARLAAGLTQTDVALRLGITSETYGQIELGKQCLTHAVELSLTLALLYNPTPHTKAYAIKVKMDQRKLAGLYLQKIRIHLGMSQPEFSEKIGKVSSVGIARMEKGDFSKPNTKTLLKRIDNVLL